MRADFVHRDLGAARHGRHFIGNDDIDRQWHFGTTLLHDVHDHVGFIDQVRLRQRVADAFAGSEQEGVCDAAADNQLVDLVSQRLEDGQLGRHLRAGNNGHQRASRVFKRAGKSVDFTAHEEACTSHWRIFGDTVGCGFGAVRGAEGVIDVDVAELGHLLRQLVVVLLLALVAATVLEQNDFTRGDNKVSVHPVGDQAHRLVQQLTQANGDRRQRILVVQLALGRSAKV